MKLGANRFKNIRSNHKLRWLYKQQGSAGIEAALLFVIFFSLFYAIATYSMPLLMMQAFHHAAATGARAAVAVDPAAFSDPDVGDYIESGVVPRVRSVVGGALDWLPSVAHDAVLGANNQNVQVEFDQATGILSVTVSYPNYTTNPLMPVLTLPVIGDVPKLPQDLVGKASIQL